VSPRKNNDDEKPPEKHTDTIRKTIRVETRGMQMSVMIESARVQAASLLDEPVENLYVIDHSPLNVTQTARFEGVPRVTELSMSVIFGVIPEEERPKPEFTVVPMPDRRRKNR
jgi:hypothetical protein